MIDWTVIGSVGRAVCRGRGGDGDSFAELKSWCVTRELTDVARLTIRIVVVQLDLVTGLGGVTWT